MFQPFIFQGVSPPSHFTIQPSFGCFRKWWYPQIIHFNRDFHINHPFWGTPIFGNTHFRDDSLTTSFPDPFQTSPTGLAFGILEIGDGINWGFGDEVWIKYGYLPSLKLTWHLKIDGWNTSFLFGKPYFQVLYYIIDGYTP